jgi:hypothetical protein
MQRIFRNPIFHEMFYVINTLGDGKKSSGNFIVTATQSQGPWSEPYWLKDVDGFDSPLFFFNEDGRILSTPVTDGLVVRISACTPLVIVSSAQIKLTSICLNIHPESTGLLIDPVNKSRLKGSLIL